MYVELTLNSLADFNLKNWFGIKALRLEIII